MAALAGDVRFTLVQFDADFLQHLTFQYHLADHPLAVGKVGTYQIPSLLAQFVGLQLFCGTVQDILLLLRAQATQQVHRHILLFILQVGKHVQCLLLFFPQLVGLSEFLDDDRFPVIDPYIQNHHETYQNTLDAEEQHGDLGMREGYRYHWQQSDGKAESGSVELLALGGNGEYKHDKDIAHHAQVVPIALKMQTEHTVNRQFDEYEDIEQRDAGLEYHLALQHHIHQQRQCEGMDYIIEHAPPYFHHVKQKEVVGNNEYLYQSQKDEGNHPSAIHHSTVIRA